MNPPGHSAGRQPFAFHIALAPTATLLGQADKEADAPKVLLTCPRWQRHDQAVQGSGTLLWLPRETARLGQHSLAMLPHAPGPVPREDEALSPPNGLANRDTFLLASGPTATALEAESGRAG